MRTAALCLARELPGHWDWCCTVRGVWHIFLSFRFLTTSFCSSSCSALDSPPAKYEQCPSANSCFPFMTLRFSVRTVFLRAQTFFSSFFFFFFYCSTGVCVRADTNKASGTRAVGECCRFGVCVANGDFVHGYCHSHKRQYMSSSNKQNKQEKKSYPYVNT